MSLIYSDTSTLVPYYADEQFSSLVQKTFSSGEIFISSLTELEFYSFLNRMIRTGGITQKQKKKVLTLFNDHLRQGMFNMIQVTIQFLKRRDGVWKNLISHYELWIHFILGL